MKNRYEIIGDTAKIEVVRKDGSTHYVLVDADMVGKINETFNSVYICKKRNTYYAVGSTKGNSYLKVFLHRFVTNAPDGMVVDHIDGNGLNNKRSNLRVTDNSLNIANQPRKGQSNSGIKNIYWCNRYKKYKVQFRLNGKSISLGYHKDLSKAIEVRDKFAKEHNIR